MTVYAGINGNFHSDDEVYRYGPPNWQISDYRPLPCGVVYLGDGAWDIPLGAEIDACDGDGDDWLLTMPDGAVFHVWSQDGEVTR